MTKEIQPKNLMLFTDRDVNDVDSLIESTPSKKLREEKKQTILSQIARQRAYGECRKQKCGGQACVDFIDFQVSRNPIEPHSSRARLQVNYLKNQIELYPDQEMIDRSGDYSNNGYYLESVICTDERVNSDLRSINPFGLIILTEDTQLPSIAQQSGSCPGDSQAGVLGTAYSELKDWSAIAAAMAVGAASSVREGYADLKETMQYCPKEAVQLCFYRGISIVSLGTSAWSNEQAKIKADTINIMRLTKGRGESHEVKIKRLERSFAEKKHTFSREDQRSIESLFANIGAKQIFDYDGTLPKLLDEIESILKLPKKSKMISADVEGVELVKQLKNHNYPDDFIERAYRAAALTDVATRHKVFIPIRPIYIMGPPGVGKTFYLEIIAKALGLPLCMMKVKNAENAVEELVGSPGRQGNPSSPGLLAKCLMSQKDSDGKELEENVENPLMFFDELDRVMNSMSSGPLRARALGLFNNSEQDRKTPSEGLKNVTIDISKALLFIAANGPIRPEPTGPAPGQEQRQIQTQGQAPANPEGKKEATSAPGGTDKDKNQFDPAFESRLDVVAMTALDKTAKEAIGKSWREKAMVDFGIDVLDPDLLEAHDQIIKNDTHEGIREMKSLIFENVAIQAARKLGWKLNPVDYRKKESDIKLKTQPEALQN